MTEPIDWDNMFIDDDFVFDFEAPVLSDSPPVETFSNSSQDSVSSWIGQIESMLMNDDDQEQQITLESEQQPISGFLADILVDSPVEGCNSGDVVVDSPVNVSDDSRNGCPEKENTDGSSDKAADASDDSGNESPEKESADLVVVNKDGERSDDPIAKKRRRQLKNRDAAVRSRERRKVYLMDLEMKSKYLERECVRLGRLLQCFVAENQALRLCLQKGGNACDASVAKQESAVLFWESLLLGSLLWSLAIICLFPLPPVESIPPETVGKIDLESVAPRGQGNEAASSSSTASLVGERFVKSRRCKASRRRMKLVSNGVGVSA